MTKLDVAYAYHCGTLCRSQVGSFAYVILSEADGNCIIICVDLVLLMGWMYSPKLFCMFSETYTDVTNALVHMYLPILEYGAIVNISETGPGPPHNLDSLTHKDCYIDDVITMVKSGTERQRQVIDGTAWALKWLFQYFPGETKGSMSVKKLWAGEGN